MIVPIVCIEEIILKSLKLLGLRKELGYVSDKKITYLLDMFDYQKLENEFVLTEYEKVSLEHVYKQILNNSLLKCVHNVTKEKVGKEYLGIFYRGACLCSKFCRGIGGYSELEKASVMYMNLPVCIRDDNIISVVNKIGLRTNKVTSNAIYLNVSKHYTDMCNSMCVDKVHIDRGLIRDWFS